MWRKRNSPKLLLGTQTETAATVQNGMEVPRKGETTSTLCSQQSHYWIFVQRLQEHEFKGIRAPPCYSSINYNSQEREAAQVPIGLTNGQRRHMDKVVHMHANTHTHTHTDTHTHTHRERETERERESGEYYSPLK